MSKSAKKSELRARKKLFKLLNQCTSAQVDFFKTIFPKKVPSNKLRSAIALCTRTLTGNFKDGIRPLHRPKGGVGWLVEEIKSDEKSPAVTGFWNG